MRLNNPQAVVMGQGKLHINPNTSRLQNVNALCVAKICIACLATGPSRRRWGKASCTSIPPSPCWGTCWALPAPWRRSLLFKHFRQVQIF